MLEDGQLSPDDMLELIAKFKKIIGIFYPTLS